MILFKNNSTARLGAAALAAATTIHLGAGQGPLFPTITSGSGDYYYVTIVHPVNETYEIVRVIQGLGDSLIVTRAQQGTIALDFPINSLVELRWTATFAQQVVNYIPPRATETTYGTVRFASASEIELGLGDGVITAVAAGDNLKNKDIVGTIIVYPSNTIPEGYLLCNGASILRTSYPKLFNVIGYTYGGSGDNFNIPDLRGKFIRGAGGNAGALGETQLDTIGSFSGTLTISGIYYRTYNDGHHDANSANIAGNAMGRMNPGYLSSGGVSLVGSGNETKPINMAFNYLIKY